MARNVDYRVACHFVWTYRVATYGARIDLSIFIAFSPSIQLPFINCPFGCTVRWYMLLPLRVMV